MTKEKILEQFDEKYIKKDEERPRFCSCVEGDLYGAWEDDIAELKSFLSQSLDSYGEMMYERGKNQGR